MVRSFSIIYLVCAVLLIVYPSCVWRSRQLFQSFCCQKFEACGPVCYTQRIPKTNELRWFWHFYHNKSLNYMKVKMVPICFLVPQRWRVSFGGISGTIARAWNSTATSRTPQRHAAYGVTDYMDQAIMKDFRKSMEITYWVIACNRIYTNNLLYCNVFVWEVSIRPFLHHLGADQNWIEESQNTKLNQYMIFLPQWVAWTYAAVQSCMSIAYILLTNVEAGFITSCVFFLHSCCFDIHCLHWCFSTRKRIQISLDLARGRSRRGILPGTIRNALSWA